MARLPMPAAPSGRDDDVALRNAWKNKPVRPKYKTKDTPSAHKNAGASRIIIIAWGSEHPECEGNDDRAR